MPREDIIEARDTPGLETRNAASQGRIVRDLRSRLVKLEMENAELAETCAKLEAAMLWKNPEFERLFNMSHDMLGIVGTDGCFRRINPEFARVLGYQEEEPTCHDFLALVHPDDVASTRAAMQRLAEGDEVLDFVNRCLCADGSHRWLEWQAHPCGEGVVCALARDITGCRKTREHLENEVHRRTTQLQERTRQLSALAGELTHAEEHVRRKIAGVIHEDLQQTLVAAVLNLDMLKSKPGNQSLSADFARIDGILRDSIKTARSLSAELSPPVLQQCGLAAAIKWLGDQNFEKYGLAVTVDAEDGVDPKPEAGITLFRGVSELLLNVIKHSGVKSAALRMRRTDGKRMEIELRDEGVGFDPEKVRAREGSAGGFGLFSIRERLEWLGGGFDIKSVPGGGSRFTLWVPLESSG